METIIFDHLIPGKNIQVIEQKLLGVVARKTETFMLDKKKLKPNKDNPRYIKSEKFETLKKSIKASPWMLLSRPVQIDEEGIILGGNMRYRAAIKSGLKEIPVEIMLGRTEEEKAEFIIKDNVGFGAWDYDILANNYDHATLIDWGMDMPLSEQIDEAEDGEEIEMEQSVQIEPPMEYIMIIANPNSVDWEEIKETLKLKMVRKGGYKKGSAFDAISLERVIEWEDFKERYKKS
jgi:hypothetical protein